MLLSDIKEVHIFVGHPILEIPEETKKSLVGNSTLILLTILYKQGNEEEKKAVLTVVRELINNTLDAKAATQKYWVDNMRDEEIKKVGESLLKG
jgi:protein involved in ribonucleotide reduction